MYKSFEGFSTDIETLAEKSLPLNETRNYLAPHVWPLYHDYANILMNLGFPQRRVYGFSLQVGVDQKGVLHLLGPYKEIKNITPQKFTLTDFAVGKPSCTNLLQDVQTVRITPDSILCPECRFTTYSSTLQVFEKMDYISDLQAIISLTKSLRYITPPNVEEIALAGVAGIEALTPYNNFKSDVRYLKKHSRLALALSPVEKDLFASAVDEISEVLDTKIQEVKSLFKTETYRQGLLKDLTTFTPEPCKLVFEGPQLVHFGETEKHLSFSPSVIAAYGTLQNPNYVVVPGELAQILRHLADLKVLPVLRFFSGPIPAPDRDFAEIVATLHNEFYQREEPYRKTLEEASKLAALM